jgi:hypothetical protein
LTIPQLVRYCRPGHFIQAEVMALGPLYQAAYRPLFSGHETFPLRYGWLKKAYDALEDSATNPGNKSIFLSDGAIGTFGVGKNMVASIRHWATSCGIICEEPGSNRLTVTALGRFLFGPNGVDPYLEHPASLWLIHWYLCSGENPRGLKTTWFWAFSQFTGSIFRREDLIDGLMKLVEVRGWPRASRTTIQRDVECFVRSYESRPAGHRGTAEDNLESSFAELGLIRGLHGQFQFTRGPKRSLPDEVFALALNSFWNRLGTTRTLSFEAIVHEPGSPGRIFLLDEGDIADRLLAMEVVTAGVLRWSETAGLRQALRTRALTEDETFELLKRYYGRPLIEGSA